MNIIYYLIPIALIFLIVGVVAFLWATKSNQFEDMEKHGLSILMDDDVNTKQDKNTNFGESTSNQNGHK